jgi:hypothetical protein
MHLFTEELRDNTLSLGIGKTCDGGTGGMAALEGLVAATEVSIAYIIWNYSPHKLPQSPDVR